MIAGRQFPANKITWSNYKWAVTKVARWRGVLRWVMECQDLRRDIEAGRTAVE